jgi:hypothetical protein
MKKLSRAGIAGGVAAVAIGIIVAACGSSGPPSASSVVSSDGYTVVTSQTGSAAASGSGAAAPYITSIADGTKSDGTAEVVLVFGKNNGAAELADINSTLQAALPSGVTASISGEILRLDGTPSALSNFKGLP